MYDVETIKVVILGEAEVGKTCIINQFSDHTFWPNTCATLFAYCIGKTIDFERFQRSIKFEIWDTQGIEKYRPLVKFFYKDARVVIFVYDVTDADSFESIKNYWYEVVKNNSVYSDYNLILAVVANKIDLFDKQRVSNKDGKEFADKIGAIFQTISCLEDSGVNALFDKIGKTYFCPEYDDLEMLEIEKKGYIKKKQEKQKQEKQEFDNQKKINKIENLSKKKQEFIEKTKINENLKKKQNPKKQEFDNQKKDSKIENLNKKKKEFNEKTKIFDKKENINISLPDKPNEEYKNKINELGKRIKELEMQLEEKNKIIREEKIKNNSLMKKILELKNILNKKKKSKEIIELEKEINLFRSYYNFSSKDKLISIKFISIYQDINYDLIAKNSDEFSKLEKILYDNYPKYKDTENYFLVGGKKINRNITLMENEVKDEDVITLGINEFA